ncbi:MAG: transcription termination factor NusA [Bdellovibrionales bacterium]|nr:transcription termination factor NusA [Bdellovibrionales bacterium]
MNLSELSRVIESVGRDRGIKREIIVSAIEQAILAAAQKKYGPHAILEAHYNDENGDVDLYLFKKVVDSDDDMLEESEEIKVQDALELDPQAQIGDELGVKVETPSFGRVDAQTAKQIIFQKVRDAERDIIFNEYMPLKGEILSGIARRMERGNLVIDLGKTDAYLPKNEIIPGENYKPGDRVQAILIDVATTTKGPALYISRTSPKYLMKLFEQEVPEIRDGIIEIKQCSREPGSRAKMAVVSKDRDIDPVGACVGMKGVRVQQVIQELKGEKIDIIPWSDNPMVFARSALSPAEISSIRIDERNKSMEIMVEDTQLSLAIGKRGQNVRLAAQITGWKLDIISKTKLQKRIQDAITNLMLIEGVSETQARALAQVGVLNIRQLAETTIESILRVPGFEEREVAERYKAKAQALVDEGASFVNGVQSTVNTITPDNDAKSVASEKLKEMIQQAEGASAGGTAE